jgi:hypothetical protein
MKSSGTVLQAVGIVRRDGGAVLRHPEVGVHAPASTGTRSASEVARVFQLAVAPASWYLVVAVVASDCWFDAVRWVWWWARCSRQRG